MTALTDRLPCGPRPEHHAVTVFTRGRSLDGIRGHTVVPNMGCNACNACHIVAVSLVFFRS